MDSSSGENLGPDACHSEASLMSAGLVYAVATKPRAA